MTTAQVVETSVTVNSNSPLHDYVHPDDQTQPFEMTPGFKPFTNALFLCLHIWKMAITCINHQTLIYFNRETLDSPILCSASSNKAAHFPHAF
ncbi:MAG: hypothetical protein MI923_25750, partial [Phycisphaerales bacterium]|nr:hypothetical protein [Phycisphaerales bacterium]